MQFLELTPEPKKTLKKNSQENSQENRKGRLKKRPLKNTVFYVLLWALLNSRIIIVKTEGPYHATEHGQENK